MVSFPTPQPPAPASDLLDMNLAFQARDVLSILAGRLPTRAELEALQAEKGLEFASIVLHRSILQAQPHSGFSRHVHTMVPRPLRRLQGEEPIEVVVVPSVSWNPTGGVGTRWGQHCDWMRKVARDMGFTTDTVDTSPRESITGNALRIGEYLQSTKAGRVILVSVGQGTAETRLLLQKRGKDAPELKRVRGWINIGGSFNGSRLVAEILAKSVSRWSAETEFWLKRRKVSALHELSADSGLWSQRLHVHDRMMIVSVFGLSSESQMPIPLRRGFQTLAPFGPNDGGVLAYEAMARPGMLYPVPGLSHGADEVALAPLYQRLLTSFGTAIQNLDRGFPLSGGPKAAADTRSDKGAEPAPLKNLG